jgi:hypothetical protein
VPPAVVTAAGLVVVEDEVAVGAGFDETPPLLAFSF